MQSFLQRFGSLIAGVLQGFDRLVFKGKLRQLYSPEGMHCFFSKNRLPREEFRTYVAGVTKKIMAALCWFSLIWKNGLVELASKGKGLSFRSLALYRLLVGEARFPLPCSVGWCATASAAGCGGGCTGRWRHHRGTGGWPEPRDPGRCRSDGT
jgi:hypothetical protein